MSPSPTRAERDGSLGLPTAILLLLAAVTVFAVAVLGAVGLSMWLRGLTFADAFTGVRSDPAVLALGQLAGLMAATFLGIERTFGDRPMRDALELRPTPAIVIVLAITAGFTLQFPLRELGNLLAQMAPVLAATTEQQRALRDAITIDGWRDAIVIPIAIVAIPALSEEALFRGVLLPGLGQRYGASAGLGLSALFFGLIHLAPIAIIAAVLAGVLLGLVRRWTRSLWPCVAMHGAFNAVPVMLPARVIRIEGFNTVGPRVYHLPLALVVTSLAVSAACLWWLSRLSEPTDE